MFNNKYPYTDFHELNLDWILKKITEMDDKISSIKEDILDESKGYTDEAIANRLSGIDDEFDNFKVDILGRISNIDSKYENFTRLIDAKLQLMQADIDAFDARLTSGLNSAHQYTDTRITQNNEYILDEIGKGLVDLKVLNPFTGDYVSIQAMFEALADYHLDAVSYQHIIDANKTYAELEALDKTYNEWATKSAEFI